MLIFAVNNHGILFNLDAGRNKDEKHMEAPSMHQGSSTYTSRAKQKRGADYNWNRKILRKRFSTLDAARYDLSKLGCVAGM